MNLVSVQDFEEHAIKILPRNASDFYRSGAGSEETLLRNKSAFKKLKIRPRCLRDVSQRDLTVTVLGEKVTIPIGISPTSMHRMAHPEGECATIRAAQAVGTIYTPSIGSTTSIEELARTAPNCIKWLQMYIFADKEITKNIVRRGEKSGFKAIVLTIDGPVIGLKRADVRNKFALPNHLRWANFDDQLAIDICSESDGSALTKFADNLFASNVTWEDIKWLKSFTILPLILKGILTAEDAIIAADLGVAGIFVSNQGGRQLDGSPSTIEALPEVVKAVGDKVEIFLDGGVRNGSDVFKALALGAKMVFVGRPILWGLAQGGEEGVKQVLNTLRNEFDSVLGLTGCASIRDIEPGMVVHESVYSKL